MRFFAGMLLILVFPAIVFAEKICPVNGEVFPDYAMFCPKHGKKLLEANKKSEPVSVMEERIMDVPGVISDPWTGMEFVFIKGGCFQMGDTFGDGGIDERPVHEVCADDFYMGKYEVTQGEWSKIMGYNPSRYKEGDQYPVENVSWDDAQEFIKILNVKSNGGFRLPTEAEWEYACRNGGKKTAFPWGNEKPVCSKGAKNGAKFDDKWKCGATGTDPVGSYAPNELGLYDMAGNVWEWTQDTYIGDAYKSHSKRNPVATEETSLRVERGGSWVYDWKYLRCSQRDYYAPWDSSSVLGLRLVTTMQIGKRRGY